MTDQGNGTTLLYWDRPRVRGWSEVSYYTVVIEGGGDMKTLTVNEPSVLIPGGFTTIDITVTNICQETTSLGQLISNNNGNGELVIIASNILQPPGDDSRGGIVVAGNGTYY